MIDLKAPETELVDAYVEAGRGGGFDVVLDYLWGCPVEILLTAMRRKGFPAPGTGTRLIQIGDIAGSAISLPAEALRSAGLTMVGSGVMPPIDILSAAFQQLMDLAAHGGIHVDVEPVPLSDIENAWIRSDLHGRRLVMVP